MRLSFGCPPVSISSGPSSRTCRNRRRTFLGERPFCHLRQAFVLHRRTAGGDGCVVPRLHYYGRISPCGRRTLERKGAETFGTLPGRQTSGLTATNVRYLDNNRDMAEELFDGRIASEMTLGEAIVRGILPAPKYVTTVFRYQNELAKYQARVNSMHSPGCRTPTRNIWKLCAGPWNKPTVSTRFSQSISQKHVGNILCFVPARNTWTRWYPMCRSGLWA